MAQFAITSADVRNAATRIRHAVIRTPLMEFATLNGIAGGRILVKFEGAQRTGAFKFRGAYNRLARITDREKKPAGVVAWSGGNHAQGVAAAARMLGIRAAIIMPADAPSIKIVKTRALGAEVIIYDRKTQSREDIAIALATERGAILVPSFDDPDVIAGQGTVGLEILEQADELGVPIRQILVGCGGGGLAAGIATAVKALEPVIAIYSVEPEGFDDTARSLVSGKRESISGHACSICDALLAPSPGELTFPIMKSLLAGGLTVSDDQIRFAMRFAFEDMKLVVEPGGAAALAAVLARVLRPVDQATVVIVSGSNVDPTFFASLLNG